MDISNYQSYFHDGVIINIEHKEHEIVISMESCQLEPEWSHENIVLSSFDTIKGKLHIEKVENVFVMKKPFFGVLRKQYDGGEILDLNIEDSRVSLLIQWTNFPPKTREFITETVEIIGRSIYWENVPELKNP